ncbi:MAG: YlcI/YnfO family protein [Pseudomonadota bacterium]
MKSATIPSLRVEPELRQAAEGVLREGETLSGFLEQSIRDSIAYRQAETEFLARGLAAREQARQDNEYYSPEQILGELEAMSANTLK